MAGYILNDKNNTHFIHWTILDLHGCKCDANKVENIEYSIYSCIYTICKCIIHLLSHLLPLQKYLLYII